MTTTEPRPTVEQLSSWLTVKVAEYTETSSESISATARFTEFGLDSVCALALCGDIEDYLDIRLEPTVVWDHPSVDALARHLAGMLNA